MLIYPLIVLVPVLGQTQKFNVFQASYPLDSHELIYPPTSTDGQFLELFVLPDKLSIDFVKIEEVKSGQFGTVCHQTVEHRISQTLDIG